jgi:hypothetical protein
MLTASLCVWETGSGMDNLGVERLTGAVTDPRLDRHFGKIGGINASNFKGTL